MAIDGACQINGFYKLIRSAEQRGTFHSLIKSFCEKIFCKIEFNFSQNGRFEPIYHFTYLAVFISVLLLFFFVNIFSCIAPFLVFLPFQYGCFLLLPVQLSFLSLPTPTCDIHLCISASFFSKLRNLSCFCVCSGESLVICYFASEILTDQQSQWVV